MNTSKYEEGQDRYKNRRDSYTITEVIKNLMDNQECLQNYILEEVVHKDYSKEEIEEWVQNFKNNIILKDDGRSLLAHKEGGK